LAFFILSVPSAFGHDTICSLNPDSGTCGAGGSPKEELRYYYSSANFKCTEFPYSGCGGNENNFQSLEECKRRCNETLQDLAVVPKILAAQEQKQCFYGNRTYRPKESISQATVDSPCSMSCFCDNSFRAEDGPRITCAEVDCPSYPEGDDCVPINKNGGCCSDYYCPSSAPPEGPKPVTCTYKGKSYVEGQIIDPDDYPCITCHCSKNFKGVLTTEGGVCKEVNCGVSIHNQQKLVGQCLPKFYRTSSGRQSCCPIEWNCSKN